MANNKPSLEGQEVVSLSDSDSFNDKSTPPKAELPKMECPNCQDLLEDVTYMKLNNKLGREFKPGSVLPKPQIHQLKRGRFRSPVMAGG